MSPLHPRAAERRPRPSETVLAAIPFLALAGQAVPAMNRCDGQANLQSLVGALTDCGRRRSLCFSLATCCCTPQAVLELIEAIQAKVKFVEICLYLDRRTAISIGRTELPRLQGEYPDLISNYATRSERLFHTKEIVCSCGL